MSKHLKILLGGSPCTKWSIAQSKDRETEASGIGWELFKNFLYARDKFKPDYFLYENNKSAAKPIKDQISKELKTPLQYINSSLVSAQNRQRFYAHNIPNVPQPEDRGILLKDILESGAAWNEKGYALTAVSEPICLNSKSGRAGVDGLQPSLSDRIYSIDGKATAVTNGFMPKIAELSRIGTIEHDGGYKHDSKQYRVYSPDGKATTLCGQGGGAGAKTGLYACPINTTENGKAQCLRASYYKDGIRNLIANNVDKKTCVAESWDGKTYPVYEVKDGLIEIKGKTYPIKLQDGFYTIRKLTVNECRRLQTIPDWYKMPCSASQNYKMLGNGWTIEVIKHILSYIPNIQNCTVEVLSMYSGMNCDLITLTELGSKIVRCVDYEIDKYAIQTASANFPCIEHRGDAFQLRNTNWSF